MSGPLPLPEEPLLELPTVLVAGFAVAVTLGEGEGVAVAVGVAATGAVIASCFTPTPVRRFASSVPFCVETLTT